MEKKYYQKVILKLHSLNDDKFYREIKNALKAGNNVFYQKRMKEVQSFDEQWIESIEKYLQNIDNIVRNPRRYMVAQERVVQTQFAKKTNSRTIQHLSSHTQFVQEIKDDKVIPSKLLATFYEDELAIYENRFVMTLISKLAAFVEKRYKIVKDSLLCCQLDRLNLTSSFHWRNFSIDCQIDLKVSEEVDDEINHHNKELLERLLTIRKYTIGFMNSEFFKTIKEQASPVVAPILRTNLILKSVDYNACLLLWQFLDSYRQIGFNVEIQEKNLSFDEEFFDHLYNLIILNYSAISANQQDRAQTYHLAKYQPKRIKLPKVVSHLSNEYITPDKIDTELPSANEYFYQKSLKQSQGEIENMIKSGKGYNASVVTLFRRMQGIANSIYKDLFNSLPKKEFDSLRRQKTILKGIVYAKNIDLQQSKKALERIEKKLEKRRQEEAEFQAKLKKERKENLKMARQKGQSKLKLDEDKK